ncbi:MAG: prepilin peptidase [Opitutales bacterium]
MGGVLFSLGTILGSFLNVCIHRIPRKESLIYPPSSCDCGAPIPWRFNLPVVGWLFLKGKAACCGRSISLRYLFVEILTGVVFAYAGIYFSGNESYILILSINLFFVCILICATFIDLEHMIIPDRLSVGGAIAGIALGFAFPVLLPSSFALDGLLGHMVGGAYAFLGLLVGSGILYWVGVVAETLLRREAIGQGDVKLLGCIGAFCGWKGAVFSIFGGAFLGTILLLPLTLLKSFSNNSSGEKTKMIGWGIEIPFGPFLALAALLYQFGLNTLIDRELEQIVILFQVAWGDSTSMRPW